MAVASFTRTSAHKQENPQYKKLILALCFCSWFVVMNTTMFNIALPNIITNLHITPIIGSWMVSGYSIAFAIFTLTFSRLSDYISIKKLLLIGLSIFISSSLVGFFAENFIILLCSRILQAVGAGAVPGLSMIIASRYVPISERAKSIAMIGSGAALGFGLGPVVGGVATQFFGWNYLFLIPLMVLVFLPILMQLSPENERREGSFDIFGCFLTSCTTIAALLTISQTSYLFGAVFVGLAIITMFYLMKQNHPFIFPQLLLNKHYIRLLVIGLSGFIFHFSNLFMMPLILGNLHHKEPITMGLLIFPGAIIAMLAGPYIGKLIDLYGSKRFISLGQLTLLLASLLFAYLQAYNSYFIMGAYIFASIGFSMLNSSVANETAYLLSAELNSAGMGLLQLLQFIGGGIGVTICGLLMNLQGELPLYIQYERVYFMLASILVLAFSYQIIFRKVDIEN
ncbi:MFS transporter [Cytobacillus kochii]|uniref:MFS transporter n=1 Tax=Cytobacillus kochii TaxID=859143 RepID=UPI002787BBC8|nr:MFS transporter [Cytobacillus kochii]MDQ0184671.1 DHA2 family metal-tetracycline-proton antiporter-like MFS transporter [Cytobacillus kochii]